MATDVTQPTNVTVVENTEPSFNNDYTISPMNHAVSANLSQFSTAKLACMHIITTSQVSTDAAVHNHVKTVMDNS